MGGGMSQYPQGLPQQMPITQPFQPQVMPHSLPYNGQSQFSPMPQTQVPYSGFQTVGTTPYPQPQFPPTPPHGYQQSPPFNPNLVSPHGQYGMPGVYNMTPQQYPPHSHNTSTVSAHTPVSYMYSPNHTGAQVFQPSADINKMPPASRAEMPPTSHGNISKEDTSAVSNMGVHDSSHNKSDIQSDISSDQNGFFVSFGDNSPKVKPKLSSATSQKTVTSEPTSLQNQTQQSPQQNQSSQASNLNVLAIDQNTSASSQPDNTSLHDTSGVGFVVGEDPETISKVQF